MRWARERFGARWAAALAIGILAATLVPARALAQSRPSAQLRYAAPAGMAACPSEDDVRAAVTSWLGYDPFSPQASRTVVAEILRDSGGLHAHVRLEDAAGRVLGARDVASASGDCQELASAVELAVGIAVDPLFLSRGKVAATRPASAPASVVIVRAVERPPAPVPPPPTPTPARAAPADPSTPAVLVAEAGVLAAEGAAPTGALGFEAGAGLRWRSFSLSLEGRDDLAASADVPGVGGARASLLLALLAPCIHQGSLRFCALGGAGALQGEGFDVSQPAEQTTLYAVAGVRAGLAIPLGGPFALDLHADGLATLTRTTLRVAGTALWTSPSFSTALGLGLLGVFP